MHARHSRYQKFFDYGDAGYSFSQAALKASSRPLIRACRANYNSFQSRQF